LNNEFAFILFDCVLTVNSGSHPIDMGGLLKPDLLKQSLGIVSVLDFIRLQNLLSFSRNTEQESTILRAISQLLEPSHSNRQSSEFCYQI
jgi:hypothetical protein